MSNNGTSPNVQIPSTVLPEEAIFVLEAFAELKRQRVAELRFAVDVAQDGMVEVIYCGLHLKKSLTTVRRAYDVRRREVRPLPTISRGDDGVEQELHSR